MTRAAHVVAILVALFAGCAFHLEPCAGDEDCPVGTTCGRPTGTDVPMCIASAAVGEDAGSSPQDMGGSANVVPWPDQGVDNGRPQPDAPVDCPRLSDCGALEPNDTEDEAIFLTEFPVGCAGFGLEEWSTLHQDKLCSEDEDQFIIEYVACEEGAYKLTVSLTSPEECPLGGRLEIAESLYDCADRNVRCEIEGNVERITIIVGEQEFPQPVEQLRVAVKPSVPEAGVEYILRATVGR